MKKRFLAFLLAFTILFGISVPKVDAATSVADMNGLKAALAAGGDIVLTADFAVTEPLTVNQLVTIDGAGHTLTMAVTDASMFNVAANASFNLKNIILDGAEQGRLIDVLHSATVNIEGSTLKRGSTETFTPKIILDRNEQRYQGGAIHINNGSILNLVDTVFEDNKTKMNTPVDPPSAPSPHGGAIYVGGNSAANISGGKFLRNKTGSGAPGFGNNGEGGAIKVEDGSVLNINAEGDTQKDKTVFEDNSNDAMGDGGGRQGGAIEVTRSTANIYATTFKIAGPFNTGGAIKFEGAVGKVKNAEFKIKEGLGFIGSSAGAINSQDSNLLIEDSVFNTGLGTYMQEAGGLITVYGGGTFDLKGSMLNGSGTGWNSNWKYKTAKYGGAISFYDNSTVVANIENSTIQNFTADISGAAIAVTTQMDEGRTAAVKLKIKNTNILNNTTYTASNTNYGGGLYIGKGKDEGENNNIVVIEGGRISNSASATATAGAIYNEGHLTITGGAQIRDNWTYWEVPGILNDGYLKVDDAYIGNNRRGDWSTGDNHILSQQGKPEYGGLNIYAKKDVVITPNARFDGNDIRVIDGQSAVLLTGTLTSKVPVSVSENEKTGTYNNLHRKIVEPVHRYVGYTVAKGTEGYTPVPTDAQFIHYVTKDNSQAAAEYNDHTSVAKWDYVFNPEDKTVVLGQRAKLVYHTNHAEATIANGVVDNDPTGQKYDQVYTFYKSGNGLPKVSINNEVATDLTRLTAVPSLTVGTKEYSFMDWYKLDQKTKPIFDKVSNNPADTLKYDFVDKNTFTNTWLQPTDAEITKILAPDVENTLHTYAMYKEKEVKFKIRKKWLETETKDRFAVTFHLMQNGTKIQERAVAADSEDFVSFDAVPISDGQANYVYTLVEAGAVDKNGEKIITYDGKDYLVSDAVEVTDDATEVPQKEADTKYFVISNKIKETSVTVDKVWADAENQDGKRPTAVTIELLADGKPLSPSRTLELNAANQWTDKFQHLPLADTAGKVITYTVRENNVPSGYTAEVTAKAGAPASAPAFTVTNSYTPEVVSKTVTKVWSDANNQDNKRPANIFVQLKKNGVNEGAEVELNESNKWRHTFTNLPKFSGGQEISYTADETSVPAGYTKDISADGLTITNTYTPETITISGSKTWDDAENQDGKRPTSIVVKLMDGTTEVQKLTVQENAAGNWEYSFNPVPKFRPGKVGEAIVYSVTEEAVAGYTAKVEGFNITNTYEPSKISLVVTKIWDDMADQDGKRPADVTFQLQKNGQDYLAPVTFGGAGLTWTYEFTNLPEFEGGKKITYTVVEPTVPEGYTKTEKGVLITNKHVPETVSFTGTKTWDDADNQDGYRPAKITLNLKADNSIVKTLDVRGEGNEWEFAFNDLPKYKEGKEITYTLEEETVLHYETEIIKTADGFKVTNRHEPELIQVDVTKVWADNKNVDKSRPEEIIIYLDRKIDGETERLQEVNLTAQEANEADEWVYSFKELPKFKAGKPIQYLISEKEVKGYKTTIEEVTVEKGKTVIVKNKLIPPAGGFDEPLDPKPQPKQDPVPKTGELPSHIGSIAIAAAVLTLLVFTGARLKKD